MIQPTIDQLAADRDLWRSRALGMLEVINALEHLQEFIYGSEQWLLAFRDLVNEYEAWRKFVEAGVPLDWVVPGEDGPGEIVLDEEDVPF